LGGPQGIDKAADVFLGLETIGVLILVDINYQQLQIERNIRLMFQVVIDSLAQNHI